MHEAQMHDDNCFVTLTYNPDKLPFGGTLVKDHFSKFIRALRKKIRPKKIRFFQCGEYGDDLGRPHHHAAIFGYWPDDCKFLKYNEQGDRLFTSDLLDKTWGHGYCWIGNLEFTSAAYVARYIFKKVTGDKSEDHYTRVSADGRMHKLLPEFITMSNRPGIGNEWLKKYHRDVFPCDFVALPDGTTTKVPGYYLRWLEKYAPGEYQKIKVARRKLAATLKPDNTFRRLEVKEKVKTAKHKLYGKRKLR